MSENVEVLTFEVKSVFVARYTSPTTAAAEGMVTCRMGSMQAKHQMFEDMR